tara:strand:+ start:5364 stop:5723 length:360 start_codon:yes stop_codon:yes gene_type:complete
MLQMLMENYLNNSPVNDQEKNKIIPKGENPIKVKKSQWQSFERKMQRVYTFKRTKTQEAFVVDILKYKRESDAEIELRLKNDQVAIIIHALSPNVSEIETEAASDIDKIRKDVAYYFAK